MAAVRSTALEEILEDGKPHPSQITAWHSSMADRSDVVIIGIDASPFADDAFHWYLNHMHRPGNLVILAHCAEFPSVPSRDTWEVQEKAGKEKAFELAEKYVALLNEKKIAHEFVTDFEKPGEFISKLARNRRANAVVMGTRGLGKLRKTILGSVSDYVLHHACCPVLICRSEKDLQ